MCSLTIIRNLVETKRHFFNYFEMRVHSRGRMEIKLLFIHAEK